MQGILASEAGSISFTHGCRSISELQPVRPAAKWKPTQTYGPHVRTMNRLHHIYTHKMTESSILSTDVPAVHTWRSASAYQETKGF